MPSDVINHASSVRSRRRDSRRFPVLANQIRVSSGCTIGARGPDGVGVLCARPVPVNVTPSEPRKAGPTEPRTLPDRQLYALLLKLTKAGSRLPQLFVLAQRLDGWTPTAVRARLKRLHEDGWIALRHGQAQGGQPMPIVVRVVATGAVLRTEGAPRDLMP